MAENPIQFVWERPDIEVLVYYLVFIDLQCRLGGYPSLDVLRPPWGAPLDLSSGRGVYRRDRAIQMPYVVPALPVPRAKTTCRVCRRPGICHVKWTFNLVFIDLHNLRDKSQADSGRGMRL